MFVLSGPAVFGQTDPAALTVLEKVASVYSNLDGYEVEVQAEMDSASRVQTMRTLISYKSSGEYRLEIEARLRKPEADGRTMTSALMIYNGRTFWGFRPDLNVYSQSDQKLGLPDVDVLGIGPFRDPLATFRSQNGTGIRLLPSENVVTREGSVNCLIVEMRYPYGVRRMWVDAVEYRVIKWEDLGSTYTFERWVPNPHFTDDTFRFVVPAGAKLLEQ